MIIILLLIILKAISIVISAVMLKVFTTVVKNETLVQVTLAHTVEMGIFQAA